MKQRFPLLVVSFISLMKEVFYSLFLQHAQPKIAMLLVEILF